MSQFEVQCDLCVGANKTGNLNNFIYLIRLSQTTASIRRSCFEVETGNTFHKVSD